MNCIIMIIKTFSSLELSEKIFCFLDKLSESVDIFASIKFNLLSSRRDTFSSKTSRRGTIGLTEACSSGGDSY